MSDNEEPRTYSVQCSALRKKGHVMIKGKPCKIVELSTSKPGKHGPAKVNMVGIDIFTGKKYEDYNPSKHDIDVPSIRKTEMELMYIADDGFITLVDKVGTLCMDHRLPAGDLGKEIEGKFAGVASDQQLMVTVLRAMGRQLITGARIVKDSQSGHDE